MVCLVRKMDGIEPAADDGDPVPNYLRTRQVIVREVVIENKVYVLVKCGCHYFTRKKGPCRHFYAIVSREPSVEDFSPECLQSYELFYGEKAEFTQMCDETIGRFESHGGLLLQISLATFKMGVKKQHSDLDWYKTAYNEIGIDTVPREENIAKKLSSYTSTSNALDIMANPKKQSAYSCTHKSYLECADLATSEEDVQDIYDSLNLLRGRILGRKQNKSNNCVGGSIGSFPPIEKARKVARKAPHGSPSRKKRG